MRAGEFSRISDVLLPFLVTRQLICGAGKILQTPKAATFCLSQRAEHIWRAFQAPPPGRARSSTRDEPHADAEKYRRLHVIVGDSNMCESSTMLKVGTASLVLEMIEAGVPFRTSLDNPIRAIREVSHDVTGRRPVRLAGGRQAARSTSSASITRGPSNTCKHVSRTLRSSRWVDPGRQLDAVESQDFAKVDTEIDWVIKRKLFQRYQDRYNMELSDPKISQLDLAYHDIKRGGESSTCCSERGWQPGSPPTRRSRPPSTRRLRPPGPSCAAIHQCGAAGGPRLHRRLGASQTQRPSAAHRVVKDPFRSVDERVKRLIASM